MKLWDGRFTKATSQTADRFNASLSYDKRLFRYDITGSIAHATMLGETGIIHPEDARLIVAGLRGILADIESGVTPLDGPAEDIHMLIESLLTQRIGEAGKRLHTGRSRNDQVALDMRMYCKDACNDAVGLLRAFLQYLLDAARQHTLTIMPGYTHMQKAQPVTLAFHLMAYFQMLSRDITRFTHAKSAADVMPLGSGALAGTIYPINRERVRELLGFSCITENALDGVSDRDFVLEYLSASSILMMHLSRFCEELILWSTDEFRFAVIDDAFATGSSIMPQKKNPDIAELIRGKTGRVYGHLMSLLTTMKGLPLAYNKDMQEDKEALFDVHDTIVDVLAILLDMMKAVTFNTEEMRESASRGFMNATDCADYLTAKGVPFRDAHRITGQLVTYCLDNGMSLNALPLDTYHTFHAAFDDDVYDRLQVKACVERRKLPGGPAPASVLASIDDGQGFLDCIAR
jgi:argininosuccinate lyase